MKKKIIIALVIILVIAAVVAAVVFVRNSNADVNVPNDEVVGNTEVENEEVAPEADNDADVETDNNTDANLEGVAAISAEIAKEVPFSEMASQDITETELENYFQIDVANVESVAGKIPMMNVHASMYLLIEAKEGKVEDVKAEVEAYGTSYEAQWERYLPEQYDLVKDRKIGTVGNYVYMIVSENAKDLEVLVK